MDEFWIFCTLLLQTIILYPWRGGDDPYEVARQRAKFLEEEKIRLQRELEELARQQSIWRGLLRFALQHWQLWALAALLLLLLALWYMWRKRSQRRARQEGPEAAADEGGVGNAGEDPNDVNGEANNDDNGHAQGVDNAAANEEGAVGNEEGAVGNGEGAVGNEDGAFGNEEGAVGNGEGAVGNEVVNADAQNGNEDHVDTNETGRMVMEHIPWPEQDLLRGGQWIGELMDSFSLYFQFHLSNSFYPVLQGAFGVGSAFEGWSPYDKDIVYQVLIPMSPPAGHSFHLEPISAAPRHERTFHVRVQLECTCARREEGEDIPCFLHQPKEELEANGNFSLHDTMCTDSCLDVKKVVRWFCHLVTVMWPTLPQSLTWHLLRVSMGRTCQLKVSNGRQTYWIQLLFGVQQGSSDIFVTSQRPRASLSLSTTWPESYAVAERKFFNYIDSCAPPGSVHLKCLRFFTRLQQGSGFSNYTYKTIVMHLLNTMPVTHWCRRHFLSRLMDISQCLRKCVEEKRLDHFILGNWWLPDEIFLSPEVLLGARFNLFHDMVVNPNAHSLARRQYEDIQMALSEILDNNQ